MFDRIFPGWAACLLAVCGAGGLSGAGAAEPAAVVVRLDVPYASPPLDRQVLDIHAPPDAKDLPVVFYIHGGGWQQGDKSQVGEKPKAVTDRGMVFVSTNYRLLPAVDMETIFRDVARSLGWVHRHIRDHGGDPGRIFVMGHSAGAQLATLLCIDDRYLAAEGVPLAAIQGCVPVDGDTYDLPAIIETGETRRRVHGQPQPAFGHRQKFGDDPAKHRDYSAVSHVARGKGIPPFLIVHVAEHPDTSAQAYRLDAALREAAVPTSVFAGRDTTHSRINDAIGRGGEAVTKAVFDFIAAPPSR